MAGKLLSSSLGVAPVFVAWSRFAVGALMVLPFVSSSAWLLLRDWRVWVRALLITGGIISIQTALKTEPLSDVFAAFFIGPILSFVLSAVFLREPAGVLRSLLMLVGFCGVLLVVRPGFGGSPNLGFAVLAGCFYGAFLTASRWLAHLARPIEMTFSQLIISALVTLPLGLMYMPVPSLPIAGLTFASAGFSMMGNLLLLYAYGKAASTQLAPLVYFQLIAATGLGWAVFGDLPDALTWAGLALVIGAGLTSAVLRR